MPVRKAQAVWEGGLKNGKGIVTVESGLFEGLYSFFTRFKEEKGTNPEELLGAAHAACFSMAFSAALEKNGYKPLQISTHADVHIDKVGDDFAITKIILTTEGEVADIDEKRFLQIAEQAKAGCPVSKALSATAIELKANLKKI
jgi:lipoyl-dependent peroxiredoxin